MVTIFHNPNVALFFNQMTAGVMDKLDITEETASDWLVEYTGDPERHLLHLVDALIGFMSNPIQRIDANSISKFLPYVQQQLGEDGCNIDILNLAEIYRMVQDNCTNEIAAWRKVQEQADENGIDSIDADFIHDLWKAIPDNQGYLYDFE